MFNRLARFAKFLFRAKRRGINSEKNQRSTTPIGVITVHFTNDLSHLKNIIDTVKKIGLPKEANHSFSSKSE
jgi:hypothetical protein